MIYFVVIWTLLLIASSTIGIGILHGLSANLIVRTGDRLLVATWLGLLALAMGLLTTALFLPLTPLVGVMIAILLSAGAMVLPTARKEVGMLLHSQMLRQYGVVMAGVAIAVAAFMVQDVTWLDSGLYHYGSIQWFAKYGSVPGITLLFSNYGFTSSWFALAAPLNPEGLDARVTATTNGFVVLLVVYQFLLHLKRLLQGRGEVSDGFVVILLLLMLPLTRLDAISSIFISPSPDAPVLVLVGVISWLMLVITNQDFLVADSSPRFLDVRAIPLLLAVGAVTLKLTGLPLILISLIFYSISPSRKAHLSDSKSGGKSFHFYRFLLASGGVFLLFIPLFIHGVIASGCPLYPSSFLCFDLPWSVTGEAAQSTANSTHGWTTWYGPPPDELSPIQQWMWAFWQWLNSSKKSWLMALLTLLSVGCSVYLWVGRKTKVLGDRWLILTFGIGTIFFFSTSPFFRFSLSYFLILPAFTIACILSRVLSGLSPLPGQPLTSHFLQTKSPLTWAAIALLMVISLRSSIPNRFILPPPMKQVEVIKKQVNNVEYFSPQQPGDLCWSTTIPCGFSVSEDVVLRDAQKGIQAGFIWEP